VRLLPLLAALACGLTAAAAVAACSPHGGGGTADGGIDVDAEVALLPDPDGGATWDDWTAVFVQDYCVQCHNPNAGCGGTNCHPANGPLPDFRIRSAVVGWAPMIRCGIATQQDPAWQCPGTIGPMQFPVEQDGNPLPTDDERGIVVAWIDAGCP
jgi:hypothetical protein